MGYLASRRRRFRPRASWSRCPRSAPLVCWGGRGQVLVCAQGRIGPHHPSDWVAPPALGRSRTTPSSRSRRPELVGAAPNVSPVQHDEQPPAALIVITDGVWPLRVAPAIIGHLDADPSPTRPHSHSDRTLSVDHGAGHQFTSREQHGGPEGQGARWVIDPVRRPAGACHAPKAGCDRAGGRGRGRRAVRVVRQADRQSRCSARPSATDCSGTRCTRRVPERCLPLRLSALKGCRRGLRRRRWARLG